MSPISITTLGLPYEAHLVRFLGPRRPLFFLASSMSFVVSAMTCAAIYSRSRRVTTCTKV